MIHAKAINHIGIAVRSLDAVLPFYTQTLGGLLQGIETVADQRVKVAFITFGTGDALVKLELLEPTSPDSPIAQFIDKRGEGLHHIAYTVDNLAQRLQTLAANSIRLIDALPRPGAHHTSIAFLHPKSSAGVLTELCQPASPSPSHL
jgi:methylmalonyl-CoA/ethylmalonyl-CoA epimerase